MNIQFAFQTPCTLKNRTILKKWIETIVNNHNKELYSDEENEDLEPLDDDEDSFAHILDIDGMDAPDVLDMDDDYIVDFDDIDGLDSSIDSIDDEFGDQ